MNDDKQIQNEQELQEQEAQTEENTSSEPVLEEQAEESNETNEEISENEPSSVEIDEQETKEKEEVSPSSIFQQDETGGMELKKGRQDPSQGRNWYAIHTYSGYEDAVEKALRQRIDSMNMQDKIFNVVVPKETEIILRKGKPVQKKKCIFPGYVLVEMVVTDDSWYVVRNTPNVTGFVGSGTIPVPVTPEEFGLVKDRMGTEEPKFKADFKKGDIVKIIDGPFATFEGVVDVVNEEKGKLKVLVTIFDRETPVELAFNQVKKK